MLKLQTNKHHQCFWVVGPIWWRHLFPRRSDDPKALMMFVRLQLQHNLFQQVVLTGKVYLLLIGFEIICRTINSLSFWICIFLHFIKIPTLLCCGKSGLALVICEVSLINLVRLLYKQKDTNNAVKKRIVPYFNALKNVIQIFGMIAGLAKFMHVTQAISP